MHKRWEFGLALNAPLSSHGRSKEQYKLPSGVWWLFIPSDCQAQLHLPSPWLRSWPVRPIPSSCCFLPCPRSTASILSPSAGPHPWTRSLAAAEAERALHPHTPSLKFSVLSHPTEIKSYKLWLPSLALLTSLNNFVCFFCFHSGSLHLTQELSERT